MEIDLSPRFVSKISSGIPEGLAEASTNNNNNQAETAISRDKDAGKGTEDQQLVDFATLPESGQTCKEDNEDVLYGV